MSTEKLLEIKITGATLFIPEDELRRSLPPEVLAEGLRKGKHILRARRARQREEAKGRSLLEGGGEDHE